MNILISKFLKIVHFSFFFLVILQLIPLPVSAEPQKNLVIRSRAGAGMFSVFFDVLALIQLYEDKTFDFVEANFDKTGIYYSSDKGSNWWKYYFEPIKLGVSKGKRIIALDGSEYGVFPYTIELFTPREEVARLIQKYIKVRPYITEEVETFSEIHFTDRYVIGVHYRGTDKNYVESRRVAYDEVTHKLDEIISSIGDKQYIIFIATDEWNFIQYLSELYTDHICFVQEAIRSFDNKPIHLDTTNDPFLSGKFALIDCLLLSKTNVLIRTSSNLSLASSFFNPNLPVFELSQRYY